MKRRGEWLELDLKDDNFDENSEEAISSFISIPPKLYRKLRHEKGIVRKGNRLLLHLFPEEKGSFIPEWRELEVIYEDDFCLVVNKPTGMAVHPAEAGGTGSLANAVASYYEITGQTCAVRHIHRLDENTTGAVLYAKNEFAHLKLDEQMRSKSIHRAYVAFVQGVVAQKNGTINAPIGKDRHHNNKRRVSPNGDPAITHFKVLEQYTKTTLLQLRLETGRTHQIRVHLSHLGHPILGDRLYGGQDKEISRQALHGESLEFEHPYTGELVHVDAPWPKDLMVLKEKLATK